MTNEKQLKGAFLALSETLLWRFGPAPTGELRERRLKTIAYLSAVAGRVTSWKALAARSDNYASTINVLDGATSAGRARPAPTPSGCWRSTRPMRRSRRRAKSSMPSSADAMSAGRGRVGHTAR